MQTNEVFYSIKLINNNTGKRGFVMDSKDGIMISENVFHANCKQFKTYQDAQQFMRQNKLEKNGVIAYIIDNNDIMKQGNANGFTRLEKGQELWTIISNEGLHIFYDSKEEGYFFDTPQVGFCIWENENQVNEAIGALELKGKAISKKIR